MGHIDLREIQQKVSLNVSEQIPYCGPRQPGIPEFAPSHAFFQKPAGQLNENDPILSKRPFQYISVVRSGTTVARSAESCMIVGESIY
jgi:hypothetical protein